MCRLISHAPYCSAPARCRRRRVAGMQDARRRRLSRSSSAARVLANASSAWKSVRNSLKAPTFGSREGLKGAFTESPARVPLPSAPLTGRFPGERVFEHEGLRKTIERQGFSFKIGPSLLHRPDLATAKDAGPALTESKFSDQQSEDLLFGLDFQLASGKPDVRRKRTLTSAAPPPKSTKITAVKRSQPVLPVESGDQETLDTLARRPDPLNRHFPTSTKFSLARARPVGFPAVIFVTPKVDFAHETHPYLRLRRRTRMRFASESKRAGARSGFQPSLNSDF